MNINKEILKKLITVEELLNKGWHPSKADSEIHPELDSLNASIKTQLENINHKVDDLNSLFKEILSLKKGETPDQSAIMRLLHKLFKHS